MPLSQRQLAVLREIVLRYIRHGEPVSSGEVARSRSIRFSAATVRNVMAELEELGYLQQPHRSAGRSPTDRGLRAFVNSDMSRSKLEQRSRRELMSKIVARRRELVEDLEWVARLVSEVTREAGVVVRPMERRRCLEAVSLVPLTEGRALAVVLTTDGATEKRVVETPTSWSSTELTQLANYLNESFRGLSLSRIEDELRMSGGPERNMFIERMPVAGGRALAENLLTLLPEEVEMLVAGAEHLAASGDLAGSDHLRTALSVLEDRESIVGVLRKFLEKDRTQVIIGRESELTARGDLGMVATVFCHEGRRVGAVTVVGPKRMNYPKILPIVEFIGTALTEIMNGTGVDSHARARNA